MVGGKWAQRKGNTWHIIVCWQNFQLTAKEKASISWIWTHSDGIGKVHNEEVYVCCEPHRTKLQFYKVQIKYMGANVLLLVLYAYLLFYI